MAYREWPCPGLPGAVWWTRTAPTRPGPPYRVLPDGCLDLIWSDGEVIIAGPDTGPQRARNEPGAHYLGLRFRPGQGPAILGVPACDLRDRRVPLADIWGSATARRLAESLADAPDPTGVPAGPLARRVADAGPPDRVTAAIWRLLRTGRTVADAATEVGLSPRQLHRRSLTEFGYGPKIFARVLRFDRAMALARSGIPFATVAAVAGYADQAHLAREVRALAGDPLSVLLAPSRRS